MLKFSQRSVLKVRKDKRRDQHDYQMMFKDINPKISPDKPETSGYLKTYKVSCSPKQNFGLDVNVRIKTTGK